MRVLLSRELTEWSYLLSHSGAGVFVGIENLKAALSRASGPELTLNDPAWLKIARRVSTSRTMVCMKNC